MNAAERHDVAREAVVRLTSSRQVLQGVLTPNTGPRRLLPQLAGLLGAAWLRHRALQPALDSNLPLWRRAAFLLLTLWPIPSQRQRARVAQLPKHPRTLR